jgi:hypothetical protein
MRQREFIAGLAARSVAACGTGAANPQYEHGGVIMSVAENDSRPKP